MKKYEYNMPMINREDDNNIFDALVKYGKSGWRFVGWHIPKKPISDKMDLIYGIFERELED